MHKDGHYFCTSTPVVFRGAFERNLANWSGSTKASLWSSTACRKIRVLHHAAVRSKSKDRSVRRNLDVMDIIDRITKSQLYVSATSMKSFQADTVISRWSRCFLCTQYAMWDSFYFRKVVTKLRSWCSSLFLVSPTRAIEVSNAVAISSCPWYAQFLVVCCIATASWCLLLSIMPVVANDVDC